MSTVARRGLKGGPGAQVVPLLEQMGVLTRIDGNCAGALLPVLVTLA